MIMFVVERGEVNDALCVLSGVGEAVSATCSARLLVAIIRLPRVLRLVLRVLRFSFLCCLVFLVLALGMARVLLV